MRKTLANEALQTTAAGPRVMERSECMLVVSGLPAAVSELTSEVNQQGVFKFFFHVF